MKKVYAVMFFAALYGCTTNKNVFTGNEFQSPIDLTINYIESEVKGFKSENIAKIVIGREGRELTNSYCIDETFSKEKYLNLIGKNCEYQGGTWVSDKWCMSKNDNKVKYAMEIDNTNLSMLLSQSRKSVCKSSKNIDIYIREYSIPQPTDNIQVVMCPSFGYPVVSSRLKEQGEVTVKLKISSNGNVSENMLKSSSGFPRLDAAAMKYFTGCVFIPKVVNGVAVDGWKELKANYQLNNPSVK